MARSYKDTHYDGIEAALEKKYGLPAGGLKSIRTRGERSNEDQVSPVGARTVYQIMPDTRRLFKKAYKVDAYANDDGASAAEVAALHLRDDMQKHGSWEAAVSRYIGGPDTSKHGKQTAAYTKRVTGRPTADTPGLKAAPGKDFDWVNPDYDINTRPGDKKWRPIDDGHDKPTFEEKRKRMLDATIGKDHFRADKVTVDTKAVGLEIASESQRAAITQGNEDRKISPVDRLKASWQDNTLTAAIMRHLDDTEAPKVEEGFTDYYITNREKIEAGMDDSEVVRLREATSAGQLLQYQEELKDTRERRQLYTGRGVTETDALLYGIMGGLPDPVGFVAGEGVGHLFKLGGIGAKTLYMQSRNIAGTASQIGEYALGNMAVTGGMDLAGDHLTSKDYALAAGFGAGMGVIASPFSRRGARKQLEVDTSVADHFEAEAINARTEMGVLFERAERNLGADASPEAIAAEAARLDREDHASIVKVALADQPDNVKMMAPETAVGDRAELEGRTGIDGISDDTERTMAGEIVTRSERIVADNPIDDKRLNPLTRWMGAQSTGIDLLRGKSVVSRAFGLIATEGTTGAGGRRRTAALAQHTRERVYNSDLRGYAGLYHLERKRQGVGIAAEAVDGKVWASFEREVFMEIEARGATDYIPNSNNIIREAADMVERGFDKMRIEQQHVQTVGHARLGTSSKGYVPHRLLGTAVLRLSQTQRRNVRSILSDQFQAEANAFERADGTTRAFDKEFSDKLAKKYLERAMDKAKGGHDVPMNLQDPHAADMLESALEGMGLKHPEIKDMMGKFARGGAAHTKSRLRIDLSADIGDGMRLGDLYDTSVSNLYRGYSRRVSGEVALAQFGILGKKGLQEIRKAIMHTGGDVQELKAFDQVAAEFLNTPFGNNNHQYMDNLRIATSLARLGGMGFTQLSEYGNGIAAVGAHRVMTSMGDAVRLTREIQAIHKGKPLENNILKDVDLLGGHLGLDEFVNTRLFDVKDNDIQMYGTEQVGHATRALRAGANAQAVLSGHRMIMAVQVRGMAEQIVHKAMRFVRDGMNDKALDDMGIDGALRTRLKANLSDIATFEQGTLMKLDLTKGNLSGHEIMQLRDAIERGASQIIQKTYIGETGVWAHDGVLKLLTQFRTFGITSIEKQWGRQSKVHGIKMAAYMFGAMSWAMTVYYARMQAKLLLMDEDKADEYRAKHLTPMAVGLASMNYMSSTGLLSDAMDLGVGFAGGAMGIDLPDDIGSRGQYRGGAIGGAVAPGIGLVNQAFDGVKNGNGEQLMKLTPGASLPYVIPAVNAVGGD